MKLKVAVGAAILVTFVLYGIVGSWDRADEALLDPVRQEGCNVCPAPGCALVGWCGRPGGRNGPR